MADFSQTIAVLFSAKDAASPAIADVSRALDGLEKNAGQTSSNLAKLEEKTSGVSGAMGALGRIASGFLAGFSIATVLREFTEANIEVEKFARAMTVLTGSSNLAAAELEYVRGVSNRLGLDVRSTSEAWISLAAAARGTALEGEPARRIFESVSAAMSLLGRSSAETNGALLAVQQIISKGTVQSEELRGQLGERLPGAFQIAARSLGVTTQELGKLLEAGTVVSTDFLPKFAAEIEKTFGKPELVDTYTAAVNRLKNATELALQEVGNSAGGLSTWGLGIATSTVQYFGAVTSEIVLFGRALLDLTRGGTVEGFVEKLRLIERGAVATEAVWGEKFNQTAAESARLLRQAADAAAALGDEFENETKKFIRQAGAQTQAANELKAAFKTLGVNPDLKKEAEEFISAFDTIAKSVKTSTPQFFASLEATLKRINDIADLPAINQTLDEAFDQGILKAQDYAKAQELLYDRQVKLEKQSGLTGDSIDKQAAAQEKAAQAAERMALELEKLASNERIKTIEARVTLDVERVKADTERVKLAFESINETIKSTQEIINKAFGALTGKDFVDSSVRNKLFDQIDKENVNRERALALQADLTNAQIRVLQEQAKQLERGDALIKVDGAGLQPHLEAFMWEILKSIQTRVNQDGLKLLLGA